MCGFDGVQRGNYFGGEPIRRTKVEGRVGKLKNEKMAGKDEVTGEMIKSGCERLCKVFESGVVPEDWRSDVIVSLCKGKGEMTKFSNYIDIR